MTCYLARSGTSRNGGVFWSLNPDASVAADRKQVYAQAFAIYGLAEWHNASGDERALAAAWRMFELLETHARDRVHGGYLEALIARLGVRSRTPR